jgi:hypothetical protein
VDQGREAAYAQIFVATFTFWLCHAPKEVPLDEYTRIARALCQYFGLQHAKCLFSKPSLTGFSFSKEVCVYLSARDDFDLLVHLTYEWGAGQELFYITVLFN